MSLSLLTNVSSLEAQRNTLLTQQKIADSVARLSSGQRILNPGDAPGASGVVSKLSAQMAGLKRAQINANEGLNMLQTADGGLSQVNDLLSRMRELAVTSANGSTMSDADRTNSDQEYQQLLLEIDRVVGATTFNGANVLAGDLSATSLQVGTFNTANDRIGLTISAMAASVLAVNSTSVSSQSSAQNAINSLDGAITTLASRRAVLGSSENRLSAAIDNLSNRYNNLSAAKSNYADADVAAESAALTQNNILLQAGIAVLAQANATPQVLLQLLR
jgi:flagellin